MLCLVDILLFTWGHAINIWKHFSSVMEYAFLHLRILYPLTWGHIFFISSEWDVSLWDLTMFIWGYALYTWKHTFLSLESYFLQLGLSCQHLMTTFFNSGNTFLHIEAYIFIYVVICFFFYMGSYFIFTYRFNIFSAHD